VIAFETDVRINSRIEEVFAYVSDPLNLPRWNSAVQAVRKTSAGRNGVASTYSMERELPNGRAINELEVVARTAARVRDPHDRRTYAVPLPVPVLCRGGRDGHNTRRRGRAAWGPRLPAEARSASGQEGRE
jgi:hypothetical protein